MEGGGGKGASLYPSEGRGPRAAALFVWLGIEMGGGGLLLRPPPFYSCLFLSVARRRRRRGWRRRGGGAKSTQGDQKEFSFQFKLLKSFLESSSCVCPVLSTKHGSLFVVISVSTFVLPPSKENFRLCLFFSPCGGNIVVLEHHVFSLSCPCYTAFAKGRGLPPSSLHLRRDGA